MDTFVDSSWYYLRYCDPNNDKQFASSDALKKWCPVDLYVGGAEHAVLHLLYVRFFAKALRDLGYLNFGEPMTRLRSQGMILGENNEKMSKSKGNVVNPDLMVERFGADAFRTYLMFMGPFEDAKPWSTDSIVGVRRFLDRVYGLLERVNAKAANDIKITRLTHQTVKKVSADIEAFKFNTAVSALMIFLNELEKREKIAKTIIVDLVKLISPFAPHLAEEMWEKLKQKEILSFSVWPSYEESLTTEDEITLIVQVNGKVRDKLIVPAGLSDAELEKRALQLPKIIDWLAGKKVVKIIVAGGKLVNIVVE
jgi:leucyl-tRNA synthetase